MSANRSTISAMLKEDYQEGIQDQWNTKKLLTKILKKNTQDSGGRDIYIAVVKNRVHSYGARAEGKALPDSSFADYIETKPPIKYLYSKVKVSGPSLAAARRDEYAFVRTLNAEITLSAEGMLNDFNRQLWNDGSGVLAHVDGASGGTVVTIDMATSPFGTRHLEEGMSVEFIVPNTALPGTVVDSGKITGVIDGVSIALDSAQALAGDESIYVAGNRGNEVMGLLGIVNNVNPGAIQDDFGDVATKLPLQGIDAAANTWWQSTVLLAPTASPAPEAISEETLHDLLIGIDIKSGLGNGIDCFLTTHQMWKGYGLLMTPDRRYKGDPEIFEGGFRYLTFDGIKVYFDKHAPGTTLLGHRIYGINLDHLTIYEDQPIKWADEDGHVLKWDGSSDAWVAWLEYYAQLGTDRRNAHGVATELLPK